MNNNSGFSEGQFNNELNRLLAVHQKQIEDNQEAIQSLKDGLNKIQTDVIVIPEKLSGKSDRLSESISSLGARVGSMEERVKSLEANYTLLQRAVAIVVRAKELLDKVTTGLLVSVLAIMLGTVFVSNNPHFKPPPQENAPIKK